MKKFWLGILLAIVLIPLAGCHLSRRHHHRHGYYGSSYDDGYAHRHRYWDRDYRYHRDRD